MLDQLEIGTFEIAISAVVVVLSLIFGYLTCSLITVLGKVSEAILRVTQLLADISERVRKLEENQG